jgi:hypothetical protein
VIIVSFASLCFLVLLRLFFFGAVLSCLVLPCLVLPFVVLCCVVLSCLVRVVFSCFFLSRNVIIMRLACRVLSWCILSGFVFLTVL